MGTKVQVASSSVKPSHVMGKGGLSDRLVYHCSFCGKDGHQLSFGFRRVKHMQRARASRPLGVHGLSHDMNSDESSGKPCAIDSGDGKGACVSSSKPLGSGSLSSWSSSRFQSRHASLSYPSKDAFQKNLNQHMHHTNPQIILNASRDRVAKSWVLKCMLANPSGSKTCASALSLL